MRLSLDASGGVQGVHTSAAPVLLLHGHGHGHGPWYGCMWCMCMVHVILHLSLRSVWQCSFFCALAFYVQLESHALYESRLVCEACSTSDANNDCPILSLWIEVSMNAGLPILVAFVFQKTFSTLLELIRLEMVAVTV